MCGQYSGGVAAYIGSLLVSVCCTVRHMCMQLAVISCVFRGLCKVCDNVVHLVGVFEVAVGNIRMRGMEYFKMFFDMSDLSFVMYS